LGFGFLALGQSPPTETKDEGEEEEEDRQTVPLVLPVNTPIIAYAIIPVAKTPPRLHLVCPRPSRPRQTRLAKPETLGCQGTGPRLCLWQTGHQL